MNRTIQGPIWQDASSGPKSGSIGRSISHRCVQQQNLHCFFFADPWQTQVSSFTFFWPLSQNRAFAVPQQSSSLGSDQPFAVSHTNGGFSTVSLTPTSSKLQGPNQHDHRHRHGDHDRLKRQPHAPVIAKAIAAGAKDQRVVLMSDGGQEGR